MTATSVVVAIVLGIMMSREMSGVITLDETVIANRVKKNAQMTLIVAVSSVVGRSAIVAGGNVDYVLRHHNKQANIIGI